MDFKHNGLGGLDEIVVTDNGDGICYDADYQYGSGSTGFLIWAESDGSVWTDGDNYYAQLGPGTEFYDSYGILAAYIPPFSSYFNGQNVMRVGAAPENGYVLTSDGSIWVWGDNSVGEFGNGTSGGTSPIPTLVSLNLFTNIVQSTNDSDGDGIPDWEKLLLGFNTTNAFSNGDGLWDTVSMAAGINPLSPDVDNDGLLNSQELAIGTDPFNPDTDGDGHIDGQDAYPLDPTRWASTTIQLL